MAAASSAPFFGLGDTQMQPQGPSLQQNSAAAAPGAAAAPPKKKRNQPGNPSKSPLTLATTLMIYKIDDHELVDSFDPMINFMCCLMI
jgi:hypothetical protein